MVDSFSGWVLGGGDEGLSCFPAMKTLESVPNRQSARLGSSERQLQLRAPAP